MGAFASLLVRPFDALPCDAHRPGYGSRGESRPKLSIPAAKKQKPLEGYPQEASDTYLQQSDVVDRRAK